MKIWTRSNGEVAPPMAATHGRRKSSLAAGLLGGVLLVPIGLLALQSRVDLFSQPANMEQVVAKVAEATFEVRCGSDWTGAGWGLELEGEYYVVTAQHVIEDCQRGEPISARSQTASFFSVKLVASNGDYWSNEFGATDLALMKSSKEIPTLRFQSEEAKVGQWVMAAGFPLEEDSGPLLNLNQGRITGFDRNNHLVTDSAINGGMSGGPLINSRGDVVGTVYAGDPIDEYENLGYAQPLFEHCGLIFNCTSGEPTKTRPEQ